MGALFSRKLRLKRSWVDLESRDTLYVILDFETRANPATVFIGQLRENGCESGISGFYLVPGMKFLNPW